MSDLLWRPLDEETSTNQIAVAVRPDEYDVSVAENISLCDDAFRIYLVKLAIPGLGVILKIGDTDDLHAHAETALVVVHTIAELGEFAQSLCRPGKFCGLHLSW